MRPFLVLAVFLMSLTANTADARPNGRVYLLRGLANVFSTRMDTLASELSARGFDATAYNHLDAESLAVEAAKLQKSGHGPIIIVGHSLGGDAAFSMARTMKELGAKVDLIVTFGPTFNEFAPANVARVINFYQAHSVVTGAVLKGPGFKGSLSNVNLDSSFDINHLNIDKIDRLHAKAIASIEAVAGRGHRTRSAGPRRAHQTAAGY